MCADAAAGRQHDVQRGVPGAARGPGGRAPLHPHLARRAQVPGTTAFSYILRLDYEYIDGCLTSYSICYQELVLIMQNSHQQRHRKQHGLAPSAKIIVIIVNQSVTYEMALPTLVTR